MIDNQSRGGTLTVAGSTTLPVTGVSVNEAQAWRYQDRTFASYGHYLANGTNTFTAIASTASGITASNVFEFYLPETVCFSYDLNGNLLSDGQRNSACEDNNQMISVWATNDRRMVFVYDGRMRRTFEASKQLSLPFTGAGQFR